MNTKIGVFILLILGFITFAQANNTVEKALIAQVDQDLPQALVELEQVVNINSGTMNFSGVKQVGLIFKKHFEELGFTTQWLEGSDFNRSGHLVARYGHQGPKILMIGHLDTVFANSDSFKVFKPIGGTKIAGPGITDMKGGDVIMLAALRALKKQHLLDRVSIQVVMTGDEESSGRPLSQSKKAIVDAAKWADVALGFEDGDGDIGTAVVARRGSVSWTLDVIGKPAHSSQIFREDIGFGAIFEGARILTAFREQLATIENLTFNPGMILGGTNINYDENNHTGDAFGKDNVIAKSAKITGDIRALSTIQLQQAQTSMQKIVSQSLGHTSAILTFDEGYPPMAPTAMNQQLLTLYSDISESLGYGQVVAVKPRRAGAADISFAAEHVTMSLDGLGLMGVGGHTQDEVADMDSFGKNIQKAAILIYRLSQ